VIVEVAEVGTRPQLWTKARLQAPGGCKKLGELFSQQDWADKALVILDWEPEELKDSEHKHDAIVRVFVFKRVPDKGKRLDLQQNFDVNDIFSADQITIKELGWITEDFKKKLDYELDRIGARH
jgi:hypothetical protein